MTSSIWNVSTFLFQTKFVSFFIFLQSIEYVLVRLKNFKSTEYPWMINASFLLGVVAFFSLLVCIIEFQNRGNFQIPAGEVGSPTNTDFLSPFAPDYVCHRLGRWFFHLHWFPPKIQLVDTWEAMGKQTGNIPCSFFLAVNIPIWNRKTLLSKPHSVIIKLARRINECAFGYPLINLEKAKMSCQSCNLKFQKEIIVI